MNSSCWPPSSALAVMVSQLESCVWDHSPFLLPLGKAVSSFRFQLNCCLPELPTVFAPITTLQLLSTALLFPPSVASFIPSEEIISCIHLFGCCVSVPACFVHCSICSIKFNVWHVVVLSKYALNFKTSYYVPVLQFEKLIFFPQRHAANKWVSSRSRGP
jgi:hypothetical protein